MRKDCTCPRVRHKHGTRAAYTTCGCRCLPCRLVYDEAVRNRRRGIYAQRVDLRIPRDGTRRRIQALHAIGWTGGQLAERLGVSYQAIYVLRNSTQPIWPTTAARVTALYDELWDKTPPGGPDVKTVRWAERNGWAKPMELDDDTIDRPGGRPAVLLVEDSPIDPIAVEEAVAGRRVRLTKQERAEAIFRLTQRGYSAKQAAARLRISDRTVVRCRNQAA